MKVTEILRRLHDNNSNNNNRIRQNAITVNDILLQRAKHFCVSVFIKTQYAA